MDNDTRSIGQILRDARIHRRISLNDASEELRIRHEYLVALEQDAWQDLPGEVYGQGFLRSYARYLGLDSGALVEFRKKHIGQVGSVVPPRFRSGQARVYTSDQRPLKVSRNQTRRHQANQPPPQTTMSNQSWNSVLWVAGALLALFVGGLFLMGKTAHRAAKHPLATKRVSQAQKTPVKSRAPGASTKAPAVQVRLVSNNSATGTIVYQVNRVPLTMTVSFSGTCWAEVWRDNVARNPYGHTYSAGSTLVVHGNSQVGIRLGTRLASVKINGTPVRLPDPSIHVLQLSFQGT